jgi:hypothetical protein
VIGFNNLLDGATSGREAPARARQRAARLGFAGAERENSGEAVAPNRGVNYPGNGGDF